MLYEMATGARPFRGDTPWLIFDAILNRAPVPVAQMNRNLPQKLEDIINRALEKDQELRFQSSKEMRAELLRLKRDTDSARFVAGWVLLPTIRPSCFATQALKKFTFSIGKRNSCLVPT